MPETGSSNNDSTPSGGNSDEEPSPTVAETSATSDETIGGSQGIGRTTTAVIVQTPSFPTRPTMVTSAVNPGSGDGGGEAIGER